MALEFTTIPDREGPAVYIFSDGTTQSEQLLKQLGEEVDKLTQETTQVVFLDHTRGDGLATKEFYGLTTFPCILIVMDDDTIPQQWNGALPRADEVSYAISQITGGMRSS